MVGLLAFISALVIILGIYYSVKDIPNFTSLKTEEDKENAIERESKCYRHAIWWTLLGLGIVALIFFDDLYSANHQYWMKSAVLHLDYSKASGFSNFLESAVLVCGIIVLIYLLYTLSNTAQRVDDEWMKQRSARNQQVENLKVQNLSDIKMEQIESRLGGIEKVIKIHSTVDDIKLNWNNTGGTLSQKKKIVDWDKSICLNITNRKMIVMGKMLSFDDVISCNYTDDSKDVTTQTGTANSKTTTNTGSMIGRAIVGGVVGGGVGAIIGGSTASKNTSSDIVTNSETTTIHNYYVVITIKDIQNPIINIPCGDDRELVNEIVGTMDAIISSK